VRVFVPSVSTVPTAHTLSGLNAVIPAANSADPAGAGEATVVQTVPFQWANGSWIVFVASFRSEPAAHTSGKVCAQTSANEARDRTGAST
jgi:hypothetical protein